MRRMYSEKQILELVKKNPEAVVKALLGQDINVNGITSKGIANTGNVGITGDLAVSGSINGEENPSLKPLYWHSITLKRIQSNELKFYFDFIILNNDPTPFTLDTFRAWLDEHPTAEVKCVQGYDSIVPSNLVSYFTKSGEGTIAVKSIILATGVVQSNDYLIGSSSGTTLTDIGVNKVN